MISPISRKVWEVDVDKHLHKGVIVEEADVRGAANRRVELCQELRGDRLSKVHLRANNAPTRMPQESHGAAGTMRRAVGHATTAPRPQ